MITQWTMASLQRGLEALQSFESVPRRWPLARLTVPLLKCVDYLDKVLAGCCWEVLITQEGPWWFPWCARSLLPRPCEPPGTPQGAPLTDEENIHLLGANFWVQPIYQELLHAASGHNASVDGERKRPCSGLVKIVAKQRRAKTRAPAVDTACVSDWIGGFCPADSLMILVSCALGSAGDSGIREQRTRLSPEVSAMVWWTVPRQIPETIPRCARQSHSSLPKPPIS